MTPTSSRVSLFGRRIPPFGTAVSISTFIVFYQNVILSSAPGDIGDSLAGEINGYVALLSVVFNAVAWWIGNVRLFAWGMLLAAGVWFGRAVTIGHSAGFDNPAVYLSLAWFVGATLSFFVDSSNGKEESHD